MVHLQKNIIKSIKPFYYFSERNFKFRTENLKQLFNELEADDKVKFNFDHSSIDWPKFIRNGIEAIRKLLFKEGPETIPAAQKKLKKLYVINILIRAFFYSSVTYLFSKLISPLTGKNW